MAIEPRQPPSQLLPRLQRALGGRAGWSGFVLQLLFVAALAWISYEIVANARANLQAQRITAGFTLPRPSRIIARSILGGSSEAVVGTGASAGLCWAQQGRR